MPVYVDTILCDMMRPEANNKVSLLGLLGDAILVPQIPTVLATLTVFQRWQPAPDERPGTRFTFALEIRGPGLQSIRLPAQEAIIPDMPRPLLQLSIQIQGFPVNQEGDYQVATFVNGQQRNVHTFSIGVPTDEQRRALQLVGFG